MAGFFYCLESFAVRWKLLIELICKIFIDLPAVYMVGNGLQ